ncbi:hypothetical protein TrRE_jg6236 [Triparma retinervis]|uniref:Uncharacterized protein n=1 Tax=Triparma retinervis TaxID=2557542 RepID=A0A9W7KU72_9STRA|nr:hypothetical protein TrRE_jg6236 [Triparma retinervis]
MYEVGTLVTVKSRTWAGINKQGGVGKITSSTFTSCSVKYVLGGSDKDIPTEFVTPFEEEGKRDRAAKPITEVVLDKLSPTPAPVAPVNPLTSKFTTFLLRLMSGSDEIAVSEIRRRWIEEEGGTGGEEVEGLVGGMEQRNVVMVDEGMVYKI